MLMKTKFINVLFFTCTIKQDVDDNSHTTAIIVWLVMKRVDKD